MCSSDLSRHGKFRLLVRTNGPAVVGPELCKHLPRTIRTSACPPSRGQRHNICESLQFCVLAKKTRQIILICYGLRSNPLHPRTGNRAISGFVPRQKARPWVRPKLLTRVKFVERTGRTPPAHAFVALAYDSRLAARRLTASP